MMKSIKWACALLALGTLAACGNHRLWDPELGHGHQHSSNHGSSESGGAFVGSWHALDTAAGYESFMVVEASGQGYLCNEDGKSQAEFELVSENGGAFMGDYEYGTGDALSVAGDTLDRVGADKGETYTVHYARVSEIPTWCAAQIEEMK